MYIGIDFGTSYSTLSVYVDDGERAGLLPDLCGGRGIPTLMRYDSGVKEWCYGENCHPEFYPDDTIRDIKVKIRDGGDINKRIISDGYGITFKELLKNYLSWLIKSRYDYMRDEGKIDDEEQIEGVVVTVPCGFTGRGMTRSSYGQVIQEGVIQAYREVIKSAVELAKIGKPPVYIIEEPVAAAMEYLKRKGKRALAENPNMNILVADLGGGTFDATVIKCDGYEKFKVVTKDGDLHLGGNDYDNKILDLCINKIRQETPGFNLSETDRKRDLFRATQAKEALSESTSYTFISSTGRRVVVPRREFEYATRDLLERVQTIIKNCVEKNGGIGTIDKIILVGGACRMPQIKNGIKELYPQFEDSNIIINNPSYSIANGAAYCASMKGGVDVGTLQDTSTCTYGFIFTNEVKNVDYICNLIYSETKFEDGKITCNNVRKFYPLHKDSKYCTFTVYESTYKKSDGDIEFEKNRDRFNSNGLKVTIEVPEEYYSKNLSEKYSLVPQMTLTSDGILILEIYHDGKLVGSNKINI